MNWGNRLLLVFGVFAFGISFLVYRCMRSPVDLVSHDYYKEELAYQQVIDATKKADALSGRVMLSRSAHTISLQLPVEMRNSPVEGSVFFYCPSDMGRDRSWPLRIDGAGHQEIDAKELLRGHYAVRIRWECRGELYFNEQAFDIQ